MKNLRRLLGLKRQPLAVADWLLLGLPFAMFFSYHPVISFGQGMYGTHYELSLFQLYLVVFTAVNIPRIWQNRQFLARNAAIRLVAASGLYTSLSLAWTPDLLRGILTAGMVWLLIASFAALLVNPRLKLLVHPLFRVLVASAVGVSLVALFQFFGATVPGLSDNVLLCAGCQADQFGFARPNAFAVEPQFFGSLLLAPILLLLHAAATSKLSKAASFALGFLIFTLVLTLSRGALLAALAGATLLLCVHYRSFTRFLRPLSISTLGLVLALAAQGVAAQVNPAVDVSFGQAIAKSINQLSMGIIDIRPATPPASTDRPKAPSATPTAFNGYVARSTDERLTASCMALGIWSETPARALVGTGVAGTGYYFAHQPTRSNLIWCKTTI